MAEQELVKHGRKLFSIWNEPKPFLKKLTNILLEIVIIVFAVSLAAFFERRNEHKHEQAKVKSFLTGLTADLKEDINEINDIKGFFERAKQQYTYLYNLDPQKKVSNDSLRSAFNLINHNIFLRANASRYEGFKSSGKLIDIENDSLQQDILFLYQEAIPRLKSSESGWINKNFELQKIIGNEYIENKDGTNNSFEIITTHKAKNLCKGLIPHEQLFIRYEDVKKIAERIILQIEKEYE